MKFFTCVVLHSSKKKKMWEGFITAWEETLQGI